MSAGPRSPGEAPPSTLDLLDALEALLTEARRVPFSGSVMVNDQELMQLVDRIRLSLPADVVQAQRLLDQRERVLSDTEERAGDLAARAESAARQLAERTAAQARELTERARAEAAQLGERAEAEARRLVTEAQAHAERLVAEHTVVRAAEERAARLLHDAEERAAAITSAAEGYARDADDYVRAVMTELEDHLVTATATVRKGLSTLASAETPRKRRRGGGSS
jgi:cell division septum initiation protein DivIVA